MNYKTVETETFETGQRCVFEPWTDGWSVGFKVTTYPSETVEYVYMTPSSGGHSPDVFVYQGTAGDPAVDASRVFVNVGEGPMHVDKEEPEAEGKHRVKVQTEKTYIARFDPQIDINGDVYPSMRAEPVEWDCTKFFLGEFGPRDRTAALEEGGYYTDGLKEDPDAPTWVQDWPGPFEISVRQEGE